MMSVSDEPVDAIIELRGETIALMPERAAWWKAADTLLLADLHFGKAATFRAGGIPVPSGTTTEILSRLTRIASRTGARRMIFLGDMLHARAGRSDDLISALVAWRKTTSDLELVLVRGNHDRNAGDPPAELDIICADAPLSIGPFVMSHHPMNHTDGYVIAGHVHPGVRLYGAGRQRERLPCFVIGDGLAILPAFGGFTGLADVEPALGTTTYAVAGDEVVKIAAAE